MAVLCGMPTIQYSAQSTWLSVWLSNWARPIDNWQVVKVICHKAHRCHRRMVQCYSKGDGNVSSHEGTLAPSGEYNWTCASFDPFESTTKWQMDRWPFLHSLRQCAYNLQWAPLSTRIALPMGDLYLSCNTWCFGPMPAHNANGTSISSAMFSQTAAECPYTWQWFACFPLKIALSHVGIWTSCNTWFIRPTGVWNANGNLTVSAVFCRAY